MRFDQRLSDLPEPLLARLREATKLDRPGRLLPSGEGCRQKSPKRARSEPHSAHGSNKDQRAQFEPDKRARQSGAPTSGRSTESCGRKFRSRAESAPVVRPRDMFLCVCCRSVYLSSGRWDLPRCPRCGACSSLFPEWLERHRRLRR